MDNPIYSHLSLNTSMGVRATCVQEGLGVACIMLLETNQKIQARNKTVCS